jgi:hypothetical protein
VVRHVGDKRIRAGMCGDGSAVMEWWRCIVEIWRAGEEFTSLCGVGAAEETTGLESWGCRIESSTGRREVFDSAIPCFEGLMDLSQTW